MNFCNEKLQLESFPEFLSEFTMIDFAENGVVLKGATRLLRSAPLACSFTLLCSALLHSLACPLCATALTRLLTHGKN